MNAPSGMRRDHPIERIPGGSSPGRRRPTLYVEGGVDAVAARALDLLERCAPASGPVVLGVATGVSPLRTYELLLTSPIAERITDLVLLDEYVGVPPDDPRSFRSAIEQQLADPLGLSRGHVHCPPADEPTGDACARFERTIRELGGVDVQILGIGRNGHIAFNEPGSTLDSRTRQVTLSATTMSDNGSDGRAGPSTAVTQGIGTILDARSIVLIATGHHKARALAAALEDDVTPAVPASALRRHDRVAVVADVEAASELTAAGRTSPAPTITTSPPTEGHS